MRWYETVWSVVLVWIVLLLLLGFLLLRRGEAKTTYWVEVMPILGNTATHRYWYPWCLGYAEVPEWLRREFIHTAEAKGAGYQVAPGCEYQGPKK